jgi:hypothetical protein
MPQDTGPYTEFEGREYEARVVFCLTQDATEEEIVEWLTYELGGGSIAIDHPLNDASLNRVRVIDLRNNHRSFHTDWSADRGDGGRTGITRIERDR